MHLDHAQTVTRSALLVLGLALAGCDTAARAATSRSSEHRRAASGADANNAAPETRKKAPVTPAIIAASQRLLEKHANAPIGSEFTIVVEGKPHLARIEEHDNPAGSPARPEGKHKGVTVYESVR
jgi:hypothetical protein